MGPCPDQTTVPSASPHTRKLHFVSELQVLQVSPARSNFHFNVQFNREFDGVFHLVLDNLSDLQGNAEHQTCTELQCSVLLPIAGVSGHLESSPALTCSDLPPMGMQPNILILIRVYE